jgi:hypothetical protein
VFTGGWSRALSAVRSGLLGDQIGLASALSVVACVALTTVPMVWALPAGVPLALLRVARLSYEPFHTGPIGRSLMPLRRCLWGIDRVGDVRAG